MADPTYIDYKALGLVAYHAVNAPSVGWEPAARAVVAVLREQGFVVLRVDDVTELVAAVNGDSALDWGALDRIEAVLAAARDTVSADEP